MRSVFVWLKAGAILAFLFFGIAGAVNRVYWVNSQGLSQGSMSSTLVKEKFGLDLGAMCRYDKPQHVEFKVLPDQTIQFRCSWFEGGGLTWWPFYTEHDVKSAEATSVLNDIFEVRRGMMSSQLELFHVQEAYAKADKPLSNEELYDSVAELAGIPKSALNEQSEIGKAKVKRSKLKRQIRWYQQTLKSMNLLQKVDGERVSGSSQAKPRRACMKR